MKASADGQDQDKRLQRRRVLKATLYGMGVLCLLPVGIQLGAPRRRRRRRGEPGPTGWFGHC